MKNKTSKKEVREPKCFCRTYSMVSRNW